jgi:hypothetical protein
VEISDELAAERPQVVDVFLDRLWRQIRGSHTHPVRGVVAGVGRDAGFKTIGCLLTGGGTGNLG